MSKNIVYHYCSVDSFLSIIHNATLRLSDIKKANDYAERKWIQKYLYDKIIKILVDNGKRAKFDNFWQAFLANESDIYMTCFSAEEDLLSQWRGYGQDGYGLAIGFSKNGLSSCTLEHYIVFNKVLYSKSDQDKYVHSIIDNLEKSMICGIPNLITNERFNFCFYKNPAFSEENEWRLVKWEPHLNFLGYKQTKLANGVKFSRVKMRSNGEKLISYVEMDFSSIKNQLVKSIFIGPKSKVSEDDVKTLLYLSGYEYQKIKICKSKATYGH